MREQQSSVLQAAVALVTRNGWLKLISLVFAVVLFLIVRTQQVREFTRVAKVRIITAENVIVIGPQERAVDVTVRLPESLFSRQPTDEELVGEIDVRNERVGKLRLRLSRDNFPGLDKRYALVVHDPWMDIELDALLRKRLAVKAVLQGLPKDNLEIERVVVDPDEVEVIGARRELSRVESISTSPVNIENIDKNFSSLTRLVLDDFSSLRVKDDKVNVQVVVGPRKMLRVFESVPVEPLPARRIEMRPASVQVEIQGRRETLDTLRPADVRAFLDTSDLTSGWQDRKLRLKIPAGTSLVRVLPETVSVQVVED